MTTTSPIRLKGMTWNHTRGYLPMLATAQRFSELHPGVEISWEKRSLQEFADQPIDRLAEAYDLLVIDHPWAGFAAKSGVLVPMDDYLPPGFLAEQATQTVGKSHESYAYADQQWALAIDAATPVSAYRADLLAQASAAPPANWNELISLGRRGLVCCPSIPLDTFCNFVNLSASIGAPIFADSEQLVPRTAGREVVERLLELSSVTPPEFFELNPIRTLEVMSKTDRFAYCPFTYGYSNYARRGYAANVVRFGGVVEVAAGRRPSTMLGGTGLAVSTRCKDLALAMEYAAFVASPVVQRGIYFASGGQPGHRLAWTDPAVNAASTDYFADTLPTLDAAMLRPRHAGYLEFQDRAGDPIWRHLREGGNADALLDELDALYRAHGGGTQ